MKSLPTFIFIISFATGAFAQQQGQGDFNSMFRASFDQTLLESQKAFLPDQTVPDPGTKSRFLGVVYSLLLPGMGELYAGKFERGHVPLVLEGFLWLGLVWFNSYGSWIEEESMVYATQHAGANFSGKSDEFPVDIENFDDVYAYNNFKLVNRDINTLYPTDPSAGYYWAWDSPENRLKYEQMRIRSDEMFNATSFVILGMIANRIWSAIKASLAVRDHNNELRAGQSGLLPEMRTRITTFNGAADGLQLQFSTRF